jgi:hypothetical protein
MVSPLPFHSGVLSSTPRPLIVAFTGQWQVEDSDLATWLRIHGELRGLRAPLVLLSDNGAWSMRPDDALERCMWDGPDLEAELESAAAMCGVRRGDDGFYPFVVFVLDHRGWVCFVYGPIRGPLPKGRTLARALAAAGRELTPPKAAVSRIEVIPGRGKRPATGNSSGLSE